MLQLKARPAGLWTGVLAEDNNLDSLYSMSKTNTGSTQCAFLRWETDMQQAA